MLQEVQPYSGMVGPSYCLAVVTTFFMPTVLLSIFTLLVLPSSSLCCLISFLLFVCTRVRENSCLSVTFPKAILNGICFFCEMRQSLLRSNICLSKMNYNNNYRCRVSWLGQLDNLLTALRSSDPRGRQARGIAWPLGLFYFVSTFFLSIFILFYLPSSVSMVLFHSCCSLAHILRTNFCFSFSL